MNDIKISHVSKDVVTGIIDYLSGKYGKEAPLTITRGRIHHYLRMTLDYSIDGNVQVKMFDFIDRILDLLLESMGGESATPIPVNPCAPPLSTSESESSHHYVAKLLFLCKQARPDIQTAVTFLSTRVNF